MALPFTLKSILRQKKKYYGNSNISPWQKYNLQKKSSKQNQNPSIV
jgi:predicted adenine nucleotide alpha hydrolase (AANH) superfamily ATPase